MGIPQQIILTGKVFIKYLDLSEHYSLGDVMLYLNDDAIRFDKGNYTSKDSGYIKAVVYDGKVWQNMDITEFCQDRENRFTKTQRAIDIATLCKDIMEQQESICIFRGYRGHFTKKEYIPNPSVRDSKAKRYQ